MTAAKKLLSTQTGGDKLYVDDVFSTYLYTGAGTAQQTINNGIDLANKGGMVWVKSRTDTVGPNRLHDSARGIQNQLVSNSNLAQENVGTNSVQNFLPNGLTVGSYNTSLNDSGAVWTFRKAPRFFDVVTYTGNGTSNRQIAHGLGIDPGLITAKSTSTTGDWNTYHRSATGDLKLNTTDAKTASRAIITAANASTFTVSGVANTNGVSYVAYLFAHDPSADGIIQCGSFLNNQGSVNLGWEPQYLMIKEVTNASDWFVYDVMRGQSVGGSSALLKPNLSNVESTQSTIFTPTATGFSFPTVSGSTYIYLAIRRPNKPPKTGTEVYNAIARTGTGAAATVTGVGFAPDWLMASARVAGYDHSVYDRLRGAELNLRTNLTNVETTGGGLTSFGMNGITVGISGNINETSKNYINHFFRRAPGFFDVVTWTASGDRPRNVSHNLKVKPEFVIIKNRTGTTNANWYVTVNPEAGLNSYSGVLDRSYSLSLSASFDTDTTFSDSYTNAPDMGIAYLFASLPGISKVGSYTGNGTSLPVGCGFSAGARFILIKSVNDIGDWFVWDTTRGIVAANDPHLSLNITAAEVTTDDSVDPYAGGFIVNQDAATNINITGKQYIFLAIA